MFGVRLSKMGSASKLGLIAKAIAILRKYGADAHVYLPGIGTVSGLIAGNYLDSAGTTAATVDNPVGLVVDSLGAVNATQATTSNKPILRRGLLNQLLWSNDASNAAWAKISATATASKIIEAAGSSQHYISQSIDMPDGGVTFAAAFAPAERSWVTMYMGTANTSAWFNVSTGVIGTTLASVTASIANLPNGYKLCVITGTQSAVAAVTRGIYIADSDGNNTYTGDGTSGVLFGGAGLFQGTLTAQQIIDAGGIPLTTTAAASNPSAGKYSWQFDGSNDSLSLSAPLFQMSDDHAVIAGFKADAANKYIFSHSNSVTATQCCSLRVDASGYPGAVWIDDASANALPTASTSCIGLSTVATAIKIGNAKRLRVNGVQAGATNNTALGVGTTNSYAIGRLNGSSGNFTGLISPVIAIKGTVSDAELMVLEKYVGMCCGVSI